MDLQLVEGRRDQRRSSWSDDELGDEIYRKPSFGTSSEGGSASYAPHYRRGSIESSSSDLNSSNVKLPLLDELKEREDEHPLLAIVHQQLSLIHATCKRQREHMTRWKDDEIDLAMKEEDDHYDDVERFVLVDSSRRHHLIISRPLIEIVEAMQAKIESMATTAVSSLPSTPVAPILLTDVDRDATLTRELAAAHAQLAAMDARYQEATRQREELERQSKELQDVNEALSERMVNAKHSDKAAGVKTAEMEAVFHKQHALLQEENDTWRHKCDRLEHDLGELHARQSDTLTQLAQAQRDMAAAEAKFNAERATWTAQCQESAATTDTLQQWVAEKDREVARLTGELARAHDNVAALEADVLAERTRQSTQHVALEKQFDRLQEFDRVSMAYHDARIGLSKEKETTERWKQQLDHATTVQTQQAETIEALERTVASKSARVDQLVAQVETSQRRMAEAAAALDAEHAAQQQQVQVQFGQVQKYDQLSRAYHDVRLAFERLEREKEDVEVALAAVNDTHAGCGRVVDDLQTTIAERDATMVQLTTLIDQKQARMDAMEAQLDEADERQRETVAWRQDVDALRVAYHEARVTVETLQTENERAKDTLKQTVDESARKVADAETRANEAIDQRVNLETRFKELQSICHELVAKNEHAEVEIHTLHSNHATALTALRDAYDTLARDHAALEAKYHDMETDQTEWLRQMQDEHMREKGELRTCVDESARELTNLRMRLDRVDAERDDAEARLQQSMLAQSSVEAQCQSLRESNQELRRLVAGHMQSLNETDVKCDALQAKWRDEKQTIQRELDQVRAGAERVTARLEHEVERLMGVNKALGRDLAAHEAATQSKYAEKVNQWKTAKATLEREKQELGVQLKQQIAAHDQRERERQTAMAEKDATIARIKNQMETETTRLHKELERVGAEMNARVAQVQSQVAGKEAEIKTLRDEAERVTQQFATQQHAVASEKTEALAAMERLLADANALAVQKDEQLVEMTRQFEVVTTQLRTLEAHFKAMHDSNQVLRDQVASETQTLQTKHVEDFQQLRAACHDVTAVNQSLTAERGTIHARLRAWLPSSANEDILETLDRVEQAWHDTRAKLEAAGATTKTLNAKLLATVDYGMQFEEEMDHLVRQLIEAINQPVRGDTIKETFGLAIGLVREALSTKATDEHLTKWTNKKTTTPQTHAAHIAQLNDHLTQLLEQCLVLQQRNDRYKMEIKHLRQREKHLERDLLLAIKS
ncbi:Aste57867_114 [Aphanomyces stellatus]|uniref:Aste57867_114 protein n=1 Tax=Aphanomyces stellatus TaxID=120398 RepID=A0A485K4T2_9STRA|nr:hypothetical protein As57867_000114 [Aphanomyces stellatus]VFT77340.1 Aste57867_114 [Aphanomyces stellatus]